MEFQGEYIFHGTREQVWNLVRDPEVLSTAIPGGTEMNKISDTEYEGTIHLRVGPVSGTFAGKILVSDEVPPESYTLTVDGRGGPGYGKGVGHVQLAELDDGNTLFKYQGEMQVGGKLAGVGQRMLESVSKSMVRQGLDTLDKALVARVAAKQEGSPVTYEAPTETEFAMAVARDYASEMLQRKPVQIALVAIGAAALVGLFLWLLRPRK